MRCYDDHIEVRRGLVAGQEAPEQFIWRDRLWLVREVISHWVETGAWWDQSGIAALLGVGADSVPTLASSAPSTDTSRVDTARLGADLLGERDVWRVEAMDGPRRRSRVDRLNKPGEAWSGQRRTTGDADLDRGYGVYDLAFDWGEARWRLIRCQD